MFQFGLLPTPDMLQEKKSLEAFIWLSSAMMRNNNITHIKQYGIMPISHTNYTLETIFKTKILPIFHEPKQINETKSVVMPYVTRF